MRTLRYRLMPILILFSLSNFFGQNRITSAELKDIKQEASSLANRWVHAWNGHIDCEKMMGLYDADMKYVWRGVSPPRNYNGFKSFVEEKLVGQSNYDLSISNIDITVIDKDSAIVFLHFNDKNDSPYGSGAASLIMVKKDVGWKIIYVHESSVENQ